VSNDAAATVEPGDPLDQADIHDVLRNDRRRLTIKCLQETADGSLSVRELSEQVAALETGEDPPPRNIRQSVYVSLHQTHLPKLDKLGIIHYDADAKVVDLLDRVREVEVYMEVVPPYGLSWGEYYFGLGLLGMLTTIAVLLGVPGIAALDITVVASVFFGALMLSATYHVYSQQERILFHRFLRNE
jgi:hypothetical protein